MTFSKVPHFSKQTVFVFTCSFVLLLFLPSAFATELSIVPAVEIVGPTGIAHCTTVNVSVSEGDAVIVRSAWAGVSTRKLLDYTYVAADVGLIVEHPLVVWLTGKEVAIPVCLLGERAGIFHGVLLIRPSQGFGGVGSWITVNLSTGKTPEYERSQRVISAHSSAGISSLMLALFWMNFLTFGLLVMLLLTRRYAKHLQRIQ